MIKIPDEYQQISPSELIIPRDMYLDAVTQKFVLIGEKQIFDVAVKTGKPLTAQSFSYVIRKKRNLNLTLVYNLLSELKRTLEDKEEFLKEDLISLCEITESMWIIENEEYRIRLASGGKHD